MRWDGGCLLAPIGHGSRRKWPGHERAIRLYDDREMQGSGMYDCFEDRKMAQWDC